MLPLRLSARESIQSSLRPVAFGRIFILRLTSTIASPIPNSVVPTAMFTTTARQFDPQKIR